ncbi:MAG: hypothetical protein AAFR81_21190 [Chloroflexota bacterium]
MTANYLLVAHADESLVTLINAQTLRPVRDFELPGRIAVLGRSSDGQYGFVVHRDDDCVSIISANNENILAIVNTGSQPTHFHSHDGKSLIFNDGSGDIAIFDETKLPHFRQYKVTQPDHGSALLLGDSMLVGYLRLGAVEVYKKDALRPSQMYDCCPMLHGATQHLDTAYFGCGDGVLLLKLNDGHVTMSKISNPVDTTDRVRVGSFATHPDASVVFGNFGQGIAVIDSKADTIKVISLPASPLKFSFDSRGKRIFALTSDGQFLILSLEGHIEHQVQVAEAVDAPKGPDKKRRPTFATDADWVYVVDPQQHKLSKLTVSEFTMKQRVSLNFKPSTAITLRCS